jgi:outer membrane protein OmpA-like peptidoglycan-associated protein
MFPIRRTLSGLLIIFFAAGCSQPAREARPSGSVASSQHSQTFAVLPVADYSYIGDVKTAFRRQTDAQEILAASFSQNGFRLASRPETYRYLTEAGLIQPLSYQDIKNATDTASLENLLNESWSDMMKGEIVSLIKIEQKRSVPGIALQDNHLPEPKTGHLNQRAVIDLGRELAADYVVRTRLLEYDMRQEYKWEPLRRNILPFFSGPGSIRHYGIATSGGYDSLDNHFIGASFTDLGKKNAHGLQLQVWVQDAISGDVIWSGETAVPVASDFQSAYASAANHLAQDFLSQIAVDNDADGVWNHRDRCPGTPAGMPVDAAGCPRDSDGDGVFDHLDQCPGTPANVPVDERGCPLDRDGDSDGDKVSDSRDKCPETPPGVTVDADGCPLDSDGDGVADYLDECPDTPANSIVDSLGCPPDSDGDGVADDFDACPGTPEGIAVDSRGCPEQVAKGTALDLRIHFDFDKAEIKPAYHDELEKIAFFLLTYPETNALIEGHTDSEGTEAYNLKLSQLRAERVKEHLVTRFGIAPARLTTRGFGQGKPVAPNVTPEGREKNRRSIAVISTTTK